MIFLERDSFCILILLVFDLCLLCGCTGTLDYWDRMEVRERSIREKLDSDENCIGLIRKVSPIPLILKGYDLCLGDTFEATIHFLAVDRNYSLGNLNVEDSSIQIFRKDGTLIVPKDVLEIEKGNSLPLKIQCKISSIAASHQQESKVRSASYFSPRNVGAGLFFDLEYQVSSGGRDRNEGFGQISVTIYNNLAGRLSDGQGKIELRRSDCINSEGLFLMFDASYGQSSVNVQVFEGDVLRKEKFIHVNDTISVNDFQNGEYEIQYKYHGNINGGDKYQLIIMD